VARRLGKAPRTGAGREATDRSTTHSLYAPERLEGEFYEGRRFTASEKFAYHSSLCPAVASMGYWPSHLISLVRHASPLVRRNPPVQRGDAKDGIWENAPVRVRCNENEGAVGDERREQASVRTLHRPFDLGR
jgi:hypothetical protein